MDFLALDFETATATNDSPCELGIAIVRAGVVREVRNWLIKPRQWPYFSPWNIAVHGIRPADVEGAPGWDGIWAEVNELLSGSTVVAHNASFDMGVMRGTLAAYGLAHPTFEYFCSVTMARRVWPGFPTYNLKALCDRHGIPLRHHRAGNDAEATAELVIRAAEAQGAEVLSDLLLKARINAGAFYPGGHRTPGGKVTLVG